MDIGEASARVAPDDERDGGGNSASDDRNESVVSDDSRGYVCVHNPERPSVWKQAFGSNSERSEVMKSSRFLAGIVGAALSAAISFSAALADAEPHARPGFYTQVEEGRLWVFRSGSEELKAFKKDGELAKSVSRIGAGPDGMTIKAPDAETIDAYLAAGQK